MTAALKELAVSRLACNLQKMGWMVGKSYDENYDLLAYSPKHYRVCGIQVHAFDISGQNREVELKRAVDKETLPGCTHIAVYIEPKGWIYIAAKEKIITPDGFVRSVLSPAGGCLDERDNPAAFGPYREKWDELLR
jgi:hypothetical protein